MKRKSKDSKLNVALTALLVVFVWLLSFSIGVISGKGWSDREHIVRKIERDTHFKAAQEDDEPLGDEMTQKEVALLTQRALEEAKATAPIENPMEEVPDRKVANASESKLDAMVKDMEKKEGQDSGDKPVAQNDEGEDDDGDDDDSDDKEKSMTPAPAKVAAQKTAAPAKVKVKPTEREISSLIPQPSTPKPTSIEYTVQVAAYKTQQDAEKHSEKLIDKGFPVFPVKATINGELWYRVSIGSFKTKKQAMKYERDLKKQSVVKNTFVQKIKRLEK